MIGARVCSACYVMFTYHYSPGKLDFGYKNSWTCMKCGKYPDNTDVNIIDFDILGSDLIQKRTDFVRQRPQHVRLFKIHDEMPHTLIRPFMIEDREPNEVYREWLELHVGKQGMNWDWGLTSDFDLLQINFVESEHAVLFELTWPVQ